VLIPSTHVSLLCDLRRDSRRDEAWAAFHARYRDVIFGWCLRRGLAADAAEDLTQDVLLKLFRQLPGYLHDPARGQFRGWLKTVVNNILTDFWRQQRRRPEPGAVGGSAFLEQLADLAGPEAADELSGAIDDRARTTAAEVLERVRAKLKATTWQAFHQAMIEQRPAAEVAAELNLSVASVYKATYRVKRMLLQEYRHVDPSGKDPPSLPELGDAREAPA
jgi:RNA polymerase sigma-70 factor (ECF subfamily)